MYYAHENANCSKNISIKQQIGTAFHTTTSLEQIHTISIYPKKKTLHISPAIAEIISIPIFKVVNGEISHAIPTIKLTEDTKKGTKIISTTKITEQQKRLKKLAIGKRRRWRHGCLRQFIGAVSFPPPLIIMLTSFLLPEVLLLVAPLVIPSLTVLVLMMQLSGATAVCVITAAAGITPVVPTMPSHLFVDYFDKF